MVERAQSDGPVISEIPCSSPLDKAAGRPRTQPSHPQPRPMTPQASLRELGEIDCSIRSGDDGRPTAGPQSRSAIRANLDTADSAGGDAFGARRPRRYRPGRRPDPGLRRTDEVEVSPCSLANRTNCHASATGRLYSVCRGGRGQRTGPGRHRSAFSRSSTSCCVERRQGNGSAAGIKGARAVSGWPAPATDATAVANWTPRACCDFKSRSDRTTDKHCAKTCWEAASDVFDIANRLAAT